MIRYGLKLWSNNTQWFPEAVARHARREFDFVEVYSNSDVPHDYTSLAALKQMPVEGVHMGHLDHAGFHEFFLTDAQTEAWQMTVALADFFRAPRIIVHPATTHKSDTFWENLERLQDDRVVIESMPVVSPYGGNPRQFGAALADLREVHGRGVPQCLDIEKSIKAAVYYEMPYQEFLETALTELHPLYFHISGGRAQTPIDEHMDLWDATFDVPWVHARLEDYAKDKDIFLAFETPKAGAGLENDMKNMDYFRTARGTTAL